MPTTGFVVFQLLPGNITVGQAGIIADTKQGIASAVIVKSPKESGVYGIPPPGQWTGMTHHHMTHRLTRPVML